MTHRIVLKDAFKGYTLDQDKICTPEETVRRFKEKLKRVDLDILEKTMRIDNGRLDIPVYFSFCVLNRGLNGWLKVFVPDPGKRSCIKRGVKIAQQGIRHV